MRRSVMREQRHVCGEHYQEVDIFAATPREHSAAPRAKKRLASRLAQQVLNDRHARRHLVQLANANFGARDVHVSLTYDERHLPADAAAAEHLLELWLERVRRRCKTQGKEAPAYIAVTEWREGEGPRAWEVRPHHHVLLRCGLGRDELEALWHAPGKGGERLGLTNADRIQPQQGSVEALAEYITKSGARRKRKWKQSRGLRQPVRPRPNDSRYTRRGVEKIVRERLQDRAYWEKQYPGWWLREARAVWSEANGWHIVLQLWRGERKRE